MRIAGMPERPAYSLNERLPRVRVVMEEEQ
jgi:hypothetical protein